MESSIAAFLIRQLASELLPTSSKTLLVTAWLSVAFWAVRGSYERGHGVSSRPASPCAQVMRDVGSGTAVPRRASWWLRDQELC